MFRPQGIIEEKSPYIVPACGRNIRANLNPLREASFRPRLIVFPATLVPVSLGQKVAQFQAISAFANFFTKNILPPAPFCCKQPVIFFTIPRTGRNPVCMRAVLNR